MALDQNEIFKIGFNHGQNLFHYNVNNIIIHEDDDIESWKEKVYTICNEADEGYRQYSPFEFFAHDLNEDENSEECWDAYEEGICTGEEDALTQFLEDLDFEEYKLEHLL